MATDTVTEGKGCSKCGETKSSDEFHKSNLITGGLQGWCKSCQMRSKQRRVDKNTENPPDLSASKFCNSCKKKKLGKDFYNDRGTGDGLFYQCTSCVKESHLRRVEKYHESPQDPSDTPLCSRCKETHPVSEFSRDMSRKSGLNPLCKTCCKDKKLMENYGITLVKYTQMLAEQAGGCKICCDQVSLVVDHDHKTGKIRGLLCGNCNTMLGMAKDCSELLIKASEYLRS